MLKCLLFDFDGVIAESVDVKTEAFRQLFKDYPEHVDTIAHYHRVNGGLSRVLKIQYFYDNLLKQELSQERLDELCGRYSQLVKEQVIAAPLVNGAQEVLDKSLNKFSMFVISGTPQDEMRDIVKERGMNKYFKAVYGSPTLKHDIIERIMSDENLKQDEILFIGDSVNDLQAALKTGVRFAARYTSEHSRWIEDDYIDRVCTDLTEFEQYIDEIMEMEQIA